MKPCSKNRKPIAWLALDELEEGRATALREHISRCEGCRGYWQEMSAVAAGLASAQPDSDLEASEFFHRRVAKQLRAAGSRSVWENVVANLGAAVLDWRVALPAIAVLITALFAMVAPRQPSTVFPASPTVVRAPAESSPDLAPTIANYRRIAGESLEKLDALLIEQGNKALPPAPVYTASTFRFSNASF